MNDDGYLWLQDQFNFTDEDLAFNQDGQFSEAQITHLKDKLRKRLSDAAINSGCAVIIFGILLGCTVMVNSDASWGVKLFLVGIFMLQPFTRFGYIWITGKIELKHPQLLRTVAEVRPENYEMRDRKYAFRYLHADSIRLKLPIPSERFKIGDRYTLYHTKWAKILVAAERK